MNFASFSSEKKKNEEEYAREKAELVEEAKRQFIAEQQMEKEKSAEQAAQEARKKAEQLEKQKLDTANKALSNANAQTASTSEELSQAKTTIKQVLKEKEQELAQAQREKENELYKITEEKKKCSK